MATTEVKVPDIGNYTNIPVIEVLVKAGDTVAKDQGLVTLESDKATMEVPSSVAGVIKEVKVKLGDGVAEGDVVAVIETPGAFEVASPRRGGGSGRGAEGCRWSESASLQHRSAAGATPHPNPLPPGERGSSTGAK